MSFAIREGRLDEVEQLVALRCAMFEAMGTQEDAIERVAMASQRYFAEEMPSGRFRVWVACVSGADSVGTGAVAGSGEDGTCREGEGGAVAPGFAGSNCETERGETGTWNGRVNAPSEPEKGEPIASIGLVVHSVPPGPSNPVGKVGYIMNLVTLPDWRRQGIARALLTHVLDVLRAEGVPIASLHASSDGRTLYEELGFEIRDALPEMVLRLA